MKRLFFATLWLVFSGIFGHISAQVQMFPQRSLWLGLECGAGTGLYRDLGLSPITYRGLEAAPAISLDYHTTYWQHQLKVGAYGGGYGRRVGFAYMQNYGGLPYVSFSTMRKAMDNNGVKLFCGGAVTEMMDIRYAQSLGNAANSFSNLVSLSFSTRGEYTFLRWQIHLQCNLALASLCLRPGFAYIDNFDQHIADPTVNTFDQYRWYPTGFNGVSTQLGITRLMRNGNRIGLDYRWHYLSSHATPTPLAPYTFEQASHSCVLRLDFGVWNK